MVGFNDGVFALALTVMALALAGCGSSSNGGDSPSPPPPAPASPADFVSQSVEGTVTGTTSINGSKPVDIPAEPFGLFIDADKMNVRVDASGTATVDNVTGHATLHGIVNVQQKKVTWFLNASAEGKKMLNCSYFTVKQMPPADELRNLITGLLKAQPVTRAADGNKQMVLDLDPSIVHAKGKISATVELGDDNVLRKVTEDVELTAPVKDSTKGSLNVTKRSTGAPDAGKFVVDKSWGDCKEMPPPGLYDDLAFSTHIRLPLQMVFELLQIKRDNVIEKQSDLIAI